MLEKRLDQSLKRLKTDYLDLYLYHWRNLTPLEETVSELERVKAAGKIKHWGVSNFDTSDLEELWQIPSGKNVAANEDLYNLGSRGIEFDLLPWQKEKNLPLIAYSPVGAGSLNHGNEIATHPLIQEVAKRHQVSSYQIMLAWAIRDGSTIAIPQTNNPEHMLDNIAAQDILLTPEDLKLLDQAYPKPTKKEPLAML